MVSKRFAPEQYAENHNSQRHGAAEYFVANYLVALRGEIKDEQLKKQWTKEKLAEIRDQWGVDLGERPLQGADLKSLAQTLKDIGAPEEVVSAAGDSKRIKSLAQHTNQQYEAAVRAGRYPISTLDPYVRADKELADNMQGMIYYAEQDPRELEDTDRFTLMKISKGKVSGYFDVFEKSAPENAKAAEPVVTNVDYEDLGSVTTIAGWEGAAPKDSLSDRTPGLKDIIGPYLSKNDVKTLREFYAGQDKVFEVNDRNSSIEKTVEMLKHMRSQGIEFDVSVNPDYPDSIEAKLSGSDFQMRLFDNQKPEMTGRLYDGYKEMYPSIASGDRRNASEKEWSVQDAKAMLDYATGKISGDSVKTVGSSNASIKNVEGMTYGRQIQVNNIMDHYAGIIFEGERGGRSADQVAQEYLEAVIQDGHDYYNQHMDAEKLKHALENPEDSQLSALDEIRVFEQEVLNDAGILRDAREQGIDQLDGSLLEGLTSVDYGDVNAYYNEDGELEMNKLLDTHRNERVGSFEDGFDSSYVINNAGEHQGRRNTRKSVLHALKHLDYDLDKLKGNDFSHHAIKEKLVSFNPDTAVGINEQGNEYLRSKMERVRDELKAQRVLGTLEDVENTDPIIKMDDKGVIQWEGYRPVSTNRNGHSQQSPDKSPYELDPVKGEIGQIFAPDELGVVRTNYNTPEEGQSAFIPGYSAYYRFDGEYGKHMENLRVKGYDQHVNEKIDTLVRDQVARPKKPSWESFADKLDASGLNGLYHGDAYGMRVDREFGRDGSMSERDVKAIAQTLSGRLKFDNNYEAYATTLAEMAMNDEYKASKALEGELSYWNMSGGKNMRIIDDEWANVADLDMTGNGSSQGMVRYLTEGAKVNEDGSITPSEGYINEKGEKEADRSALMKLPYFDHKDHDAWIRRQMPANELLTAKSVDEKVGTALMTFGGWNFEDGFAISKEYAERNPLRVKELNPETGEMEWIERPMQPGDKMSDFHGNKGVIGTVIDRDMDPEEAEAQQLSKEVAFFKANPDLDVVASPFGLLSRNNAGLSQELMAGETKPLINPETGEEIPGAIGYANFINTDKTVDKKTNAYSEQDIAEGKGVLFSGQKSWMYQAWGSEAVMDEIYGHNDKVWQDLREYMLATGVDVGSDGTLRLGYHPHEEEIRNEYSVDGYADASEFMNDMADKGGMINLPEGMKLTMAASEHTEKPVVMNQVPLLPAELRRNTELIDGQYRMNDYNLAYGDIFDTIKDAHENGVTEENQAALQKHYDRIQQDITHNILDGSGSLKNGYIRRKVMGTRMENSATGVTIPDPRLPIGQATMNEKMFESTGAEEGGYVEALRNPVMDQGAIRAYQVKLDPSIHGIGINPAGVMCQGGDFDGDTNAVATYKSKKAHEEMIRLAGFHNNLLDPASKEPRLNVNTGGDLAAAEARLRELGDTSMEEYKQKAIELAQSENEDDRKQALEYVNQYMHKGMREQGFGNCVVRFDSEQAYEDSLRYQVENGIKGSPSKLEAHMKYFRGEKTRDMDRDMQIAVGTKTDLTGKAAIFNQKFVAAARENSEDFSKALTALKGPGESVIDCKHDADHARTIQDVVVNDYTGVMNGRKPGGKRDEKMTNKQAKEALAETYKKMGRGDYCVDGQEAIIDAMTDEKGFVHSLQEIGEKQGTALDRMAYQGGYAAAVACAQEGGRSLVEGKKSSQYAPISMRNGQSKTLARASTQDKEALRAVNESLYGEKGGLDINEVVEEKPVVGQSQPADEVSASASKLADQLGLSEEERKYFKDDEDIRRTLDEMNGVEVEKKVEPTKSQIDKFNERYGQDLEM